MSIMSLLVKYCWDCGGGN